MNSSYNRYVDSYDDILLSNNNKNNDSISDILDFEKLRITALTKAAEISPLVKEVTIGPNSTVKKKEIIVDVPKRVRELPQENLTEDRMRGDLRYTLLMKKFDHELENSSEELFTEFIEKMLAKRTEAMSRFWKKQSEECERRVLEQRRRKLQLLQILQENDNLTVLEKTKYDEKYSQANRDTLENMNRILEEQNKTTAQLAVITDSHTKICICYNELTNIQKEPLGKSICDKYMSSITSVIKNINMIIMDIRKSRALTDEEVKQSEILSDNIENIKKLIVEEIHLKKQQEIIEKQKELEATEKEIRDKEELEKKKEQEAALAAEAAKQAKAKVNLTQPKFYSTKNYKNYVESQNFLESYENLYKELLQNPNLKKYRFDCQKAVNTPINALSSVSGHHMRDKFDKLSKLLKGEQVQVLDTYVTASQHPEGLYYCTALLAKKIVRQGELLVSSNHEAAFPLAAITVSLWVQFPTFGKLLEAYFYKHCPYLVPMFLPQSEGQTDKEFYLSRGYTYNEEGVVEKQDKFLKRMSGIFRLHCAICITKTPQFINCPNPHGLLYSWQWLASFINLKPEPDISATLLHDFFSTCGSECFKHYRKQFTKIIKLISTEYLKILDNIDEGGPKTRLEVFLQNVLKTGLIPQPTGFLPPNTW